MRTYFLYKSLYILLTFLPLLSLAGWIVVAHYSSMAFYVAPYLGITFLLSISVYTPRGILAAMFSLLLLSNISQAKSLSECDINSLTDFIIALRYSPRMRKKCNGIIYSQLVERWNKLSCVDFVPLSSKRVREIEEWFLGLLRRVEEKKTVDRWPTELLPGVVAVIRCKGDSVIMHKLLGWCRRHSYFQKAPSTNAYFFNIVLSLALQIKNRLGAELYSEENTLLRAVDPNTQDELLRAANLDVAIAEQLLRALQEETSANARG